MGRVYFKSIHPCHTGGCHVEFYSVVTQEDFPVIPDIGYNKWDALGKIISCTQSRGLKKIKNKKCNFHAQDSRKARIQ